MSKYDFPPDFFDPPDERPAEWPDEPNVRRAVEWFRSTLTPADWSARRAAAADRLYDAALQRLPDPQGRYFSEADTFGWYLFLAEAFIDHIGNYDPVFGSRVVPVMQAIGRNLDLLKSVEGVDERITRLVGPERAQPNGGLFELLVAAAYRRAGAQVRFVPELRGVAKTHDMDVDLNGTSWAIECKRMETGEYGERERQIIRERWGPLAVTFAEKRCNAFADIHFNAPLDEMPEDYLRRIAVRFVRGGCKEIAWNDEISNGKLTQLDMQPIRRVLKSNILLAGSSRIMELLTGDYVRNAPYNCILSMKYADNPRYAKACDGAVVLRWESASDKAIDAKARDILKRLSEATSQLSADRPGVVHIGFEAVEGDRVEKARFRKILRTTKSFDPRGKPLAYVYCHFFVPESPPDQSWAFDETTQWVAMNPTKPRPLGDTFLIIDSQSETRPGPHWNV